MSKLSAHIVIITTNVSINLHLFLFPAVGIPDARWCNGSCTGKNEIQSQNRGQQHDVQHQCVVYIMVSYRYVTLILLFFFSFGKSSKNKLGTSAYSTESVIFSCKILFFQIFLMYKNPNENELTK